MVSNPGVRVSRPVVAQSPTAETPVDLFPVDSWLSSPFVRQVVRVCCSIAIAIFSATVPALGQAIDLGDPGQALTQYRIDSWQTEQGLPLNTVQSLLQTRDGYLWVGTGGGLARFDGVRFTSFDPSDLPEIAAQPIFGLMEDREGNLWIGDSDSALVFRSGRFRKVIGREVTAGKRVWGFAEAEDGTIWMATGNGLVRSKDGKARVYHEADGLSAEQLRALAFDRDGVLWIASTGGGLIAFDGARFDVYDVARGFPHNEVRHVVADPGGGVWAATAGGGLAHVRDGKIRTWGIEQGLPTNQLTALTLDDAGTLWIGTWGEGLCRMRGDRFDSISTEGGLAGGQIWSVYADREGSVWVGTWVGGLNRLRDRDFVVLGRPEGLSHDNARSVVAASDGTVWVATAGGGVNEIRRDRITSIRQKDGLPSDEASCVYEDRDGAIWVGTYTAGIARITDGKIERWGLDEGLPSVDVRVLYQDTSGTVWAGTRWGLARFNGRRFEAVRDEGAPPDGATSILEDRNGTLWFGTATQGLIRYRDGVFEALTREDGLVSNWVLSLYEDQDGSLWIGTNGEGMNRYRDGRMTAIRPADGLWDGLVQVILEDHEGVFWITCNRGFFRVPRVELDAFAEGRIERINCDSYGPGNALRSTTFAGGLQPAGAVDAEGHLWLPGFGGLVIVNPDRLPGAEGPPPVRLEDVTVNGRSVPLASNIVIPPGAASLAIRYTSSNLKNAERTRFRYRMDDTPGGWVDAGASREALFPTLPHGDYVFRIASSVDGHTWGEATSSILITVKPYFFQTAWFIALVALAVLGATAASVALWTRHLRRQKAEMERLVAEKTEELRQANDHLARLSFIDALTGLANRRRLDEALDREWRRATRLETPIALVVADVDHFKEYNDTLGHPEGDRCLQAVADVLRNKARRAGDVVARYGGEEFAILIPDAGREQAMALAEELRLECEARAIPHPRSVVAPVVTISLGVASCSPSEGGSAEGLLTEADAALYRAKREGRNRVCGQEEVAPAIRS